MTTTITPSRTELGKRCYRRHLLQDQLGKGLYYSPSLEFGTVVHSGASTFWNIWLREEQEKEVALKEANRAIMTSWHERFTMNPQISQDSVSIDLALAMMDTYSREAKVAGGLPGEWKLVSVEERLELSIISILQRRFPAPKTSWPESWPSTLEKLQLSWMSDRVLVNADRTKLVIADLKTASRLGKYWVRPWETSLQMKLYKLLAQAAYGIEDVDVVVEGVEKAVNGSIQYVVCPEWSDALLLEALMAAIDIAQQDAILMALPEPEEEAVRAKFNYGDCYSYNLECPFKRICVSDPNERVSILKSEYLDLPQEEY